MVFSSCGGKFGVSLELRRGTQGASRVVPGKSSLHLSCEGERGIAGSYGGSSILVFQGTSILFSILATPVYMATYSVGGLLLPLFFLL